MIIHKCSPEVHVCCHESRKLHSLTYDLQSSTVFKHSVISIHSVNCKPSWMGTLGRSSRCSACVFYGRHLLFCRCRHVLCQRTPSTCHRCDWSHNTRVSSRSYGTPLLEAHSGVALRTVPPEWIKNGLAPLQPVNPAASKRKFFGLSSVISSFIEIERSDRSHVEHNAIPREPLQVE